MATSRPLVSVYSAIKPDEVKTSITMPPVMCAPIRPDIVRFVHTQMAKNDRRPYAVSIGAGYKSSAASWGTGRAVARIPRVPGGGTHRSGQGAFGNMCRGGGMFAPTKVWRRWHRTTNVNMKRYALASAVAASAVTGIVMARGHPIDTIPEMPLVISDEAQMFKKTKSAATLLNKLGVKEQIDKCADSKKIRAGKGKHRNRRYVMRLGPMVVYAEDKGLTKAFRGLPGVELCNVERLNLLKLAPGGHLGRFCIWTESAFKRMTDLYGDYVKGSSVKSGYILPRPTMTNADLARIINSEAIQSVLKPMKEPQTPVGARVNPLKRRAVFEKLNPAAAELKNKRQASARADKK